MMMRTAIRCECGHEGHLVLTKSADPESRDWGTYSLDGFDGGPLTITDFGDRPESLLGTLQPRCPACGQTGKARYAPS